MTVHSVTDIAEILVLSPPRWCRQQSTFETSVNPYQMTWHHVLQDGKLWILRDKIEFQCASMISLVSCQLLRRHKSSPVSATWHKGIFLT
jgi:hypothetical protein